MATRSPCGVVCLAVFAACSAGNNNIDPGELELRDLLGISPEAATGWDGAQRSAARRVLADALREPGDAPAVRALAMAPGPRVDDPDPAAPGAAGRGARATAPDELDARVAALLAGDDAARAAQGAEPLGVVALAIDSRAQATVAPRRGPLAAAALGGGSPPHTIDPGAELWLAGSWDTGPRSGALPGRGAALLTALAADAGHPGGPLVVVPAPELAVIAAYVRLDDASAPPRLAVNPVALAALEPTTGDATATAAMDRWPSAPAAATAIALRAPAGSTPAAVAAAPAAGAAPAASNGGNPYSFYGSVAECAFAQRTRCEACLPAGTCRPVTNITDGNAECTMLGADDGRGYFLLCINLALAITSIDRCTGDAAPACVRDSHAADSLATLSNNADFLTDATCGGALDDCLAQIFGPPGESFPGLDGGSPPAAPPRSTSVSCSNSCNNDPNVSCTASPRCDCSGPSCNNALSCDSACSSSNDQSCCGGNGSSCSSSGSGGGGGCSSGSGSGGSCSSGSGSSSGGSCGGGGCSNSGSGGGCSGSGSGGSCSGGGGGSKCSVATLDPAPGAGFAMSVMWGCLPVALAALARRRARRQPDSARHAADEHPTPISSDHGLSRATPEDNEDADQPALPREHPRASHQDNEDANQPLPRERPRASHEDNEDADQPALPREPPCTPSIPEGRRPASSATPLAEENAHRHGSPEEEAS